MDISFGINEQSVDFLSKEIKEEIEMIIISEKNNYCKSICSKILCELSQEELLKMSYKVVQLLPERIIIRHGVRECANSIRKSSFPTNKQIYILWCQFKQKYIQKRKREQ